MKNDPLSEAMRALLDLSDEQLLRECEVQPYRSSGPGGQKKNKTFSAVRIRHPASGITVVGTESRSQHENKAKALRRLREAIAIGYRRWLPDKIIWPEKVQIVERKLYMNSKNPFLYHVLALALDAVAEKKGGIGEAADVLGVTSSSLVRFLSEHPKAWAELNQIRKRAGLVALKSR